eukprot:356701-Chlamydomonas_euryale.AAC.14
MSNGQTAVRERVGRGGIGGERQVRAAAKFSAVARHTRLTHPIPTQKHLPLLAAAQACETRPVRQAAACRARETAGRGVSTLTSPLTLRDAVACSMCIVGQFLQSGLGFRSTSTSIAGAASSRAMVAKTRLGRWWSRHRALLSSAQRAGPAARA